MPPACPILPPRSLPALLIAAPHLPLYRELSQPARQRSLREDAAGEDLRNQATEVLRAWAEHLPTPAVPKY